MDSFAKILCWRFTTKITEEKYILKPNHISRIITYPFSIDILMACYSLRSFHESYDHKSDPGKRMEFSFVSRSRITRKKRNCIGNIELAATINIPIPFFYFRHSHKIIRDSYFYTVTLLFIYLSSFYWAKIYIKIEISVYLSLVINFSIYILDLFFCYTIILNCLIKLVNSKSHIYSSNFPFYFLYHPARYSRPVWCRQINIEYTYIHMRFTRVWSAYEERETKKRRRMENRTEKALLIFHVRFNPREVYPGSRPYRFFHGPNPRISTGLNTSVHVFARFSALITRLVSRAGSSSHPSRTRRNRPTACIHGVILPTTGSTGNGTTCPTPRHTLYNDAWIPFHPSLEQHVFYSRAARRVNGPSCWLTLVPFFILRCLSLSLSLCIGNLLVHFYDV